MIEIPCYPNYSITRKGKIFSKKRRIKNPNSETAYYIIGGRFLNPVIGKCGYPMVRLNNGLNKKNAKWFRVHRLVAEVFIPNPLNLPQVNHKNGNRTDYSIQNLEWVTPSQNVQHAFNTGLAKGLKGVANPKAKLSELDVLLIRAMCELGEMKSEIAQWFGIERYFVHRIKNRQNWAHI